MAITVPWHAPTPCRDSEMLGDIEDELDVANYQTGEIQSEPDEQSSHNEGDSVSERSHRCRRMHTAFYGPHDPY